MKETLILFDTAKLAKEKGFNETVEDYYVNKQLFFTDTQNYYDLIKDNGYVPYWKNINLLFEQYSAPTQALLQKWLREVHDIHISIIKRKGLGYDSVIRITELNSNCIVTHHSDKYTHEEILEKALQKALQNIY